MAVFWVVAMCSLLDVYQCFIIILMMEVTSTSEMSVNFDQTTTQKTAIFIIAAMRT
jgi:hypothetical protein